MADEKWIKIGTRSLPFVRLVMIYQAFARSKKIIGWPYGDSLTTFDRGIIRLYRRKSDLEKYLSYFFKLKNKHKFLKRAEKRIIAFKIGRNKDFEALYGYFLDLWPLANLPLALDDALRIMKFIKTSVRYDRQLSKLRKLSEKKMVLLEKLIDRSVKRPRLYATPDEILIGKVDDKERFKKRRKAVLLFEKNKIKIITGGRAEAWFRIFTQAIDAPGNNVKTPGRRKSARTF